MQTAPQVAPVELGSVRLSDVLKKISRRFPIAPDQDSVYSHLSGSLIGPEPDDPESIRRVPRSFLQNEVVRYTERIIQDLAPHKHHAKIEMGAFNVNRNGSEPAIDTRLLICVWYRDAVTEACGRIHRYYYKVAAEQGSEIYLSGEFELCCRPQ